MLRHRSIRIQLVKKRVDEQLEQPDRAHLVRLRDALHIVGLRYAEAVKRSYELLSTRASALFPANADNRLRDIFRPLMAIAMVGDKERGDDCGLNAKDNSYVLTQFLMQAVERLAARRAVDETEDEPVVAVLAELDAELTRRGGTWVALTPADVLRLVRTALGFDSRWAADEKHATKFFRNKLQFEPGTHRPPSSAPVHGYRIDRAKLDDLRSRYECKAV
jgi:hypothetical protein